MLDPTGTYLYIFYTNYTKPLAQQGVAEAFMTWTDRDAPVGKVFKYYNGSWAEPGIGGLNTPIIPAVSSIHIASPAPNSYWGPSIHWNTFLNQYVMLVNHIVGINFESDGLYYVSFSPFDPSIPTGWTPLQAIDAGPGSLGWYPQVIGDPSIQGTDKLAGQTARFFYKSGVSDWNIVFSP